MGGNGIFGQGLGNFGKFMMMIIIKKISRVLIYHTRWQHRVLYNNTNHTQSVR